jgi:ABC-type transport system substrate-binding protein
LTAAQAESDPARLKEIYGQIQALIQREGGHIIPYFRPLIVAKRSAVHGLAPDIYIFDVRSAWMEQG